MAYLHTKQRQIVLNVQHQFQKIATEQQNENTEHVNNTVKLSLSAALENGTLVAIATTVLQDALHLETLLTALRTELKSNMFTILLITHFIEKKERAVFNTWANCGRNNAEQQAESARSAYNGFVQHRYRALRSPMSP